MDEEAGLRRASSDCLSGSEKSQEGDQEEEATVSFK